MPPGVLPRSYEVVPQWRPVHTPHRIRLSLVQNSFRAMASLNPMILNHGGHLFTMGLWHNSWAPSLLVCIEHFSAPVRCLSFLKCNLESVGQCQSAAARIPQPGGFHRSKVCRSMTRATWLFGGINKIPEKMLYRYCDLGCKVKCKVNFLWIEKSCLNHQSRTSLKPKKMVCKAGSNHSAALWLWGANVWSKPGLQESNVTRKYVGELIDISYPDNLMYIELLKAIQGDLPCLLYLPNLDSHLLWGSLSLRSP
jgi:hypothetical protein